MPFLLTNIFNKGKILEMFGLSFKNQEKKTFLKFKIFKNSRKKLKNSRKKPKLKEKNQPLGFSILDFNPN